jgi:HK97 family phage portal protein
MRQAESNGLLWQIVHRTSTSLAKVQWHLYEKTPAREVTTDRVEVFDHPAMRVLNDPNNFMTRFSLLERAQQHQDLTGESDIVVVQAPVMGGLPIELWPVMPSRMEPVPSANKFLAGWIYTGPSGEQIPLEVGEVIQNALPHPRDPYRGLGPVQAMMTRLDASRYSAEWNRNFFLNSAQPGGLIQVDKRLSDDEWRELVERWNEQHKGVTRSHRVAVLEQGEWISNAQTMVDMQFAELELQGRDRLLEAFGIGGPMIGVVENVNRANADAAEVMFARYLTEPRAARWCDVLNHRLLPMFGDTATNLEFDFDSPVPDDVELDNATTTTKANAAYTLVSAGFQPDDVTDYLGMPRMRYVGPPAGLMGPRPGGPPAPEPADSGRTGINGHAVKELVS